MHPVRAKHRNQTINIAPIPEYIDDQPDAITEPFTVTPFSDAWAPGDPIQVPRNSIDHITPYEKLALQAVDELSNGKYDQSPDPKLFLSRYQRDVAQAGADDRAAAAASRPARPAAGAARRGRKSRIR